jgi:hypothetical protein
MKPLRTLARLLASTAAAGLIMLALPGVAKPAAAADLQKVRFVYDWVTADFELIPTAVAQAQGFYKDAGLDVSVLFPPDNSTTVRMLASGQGDIGYGRDFRRRPGHSGHLDRLLLAVKQLRPDRPAGRADRLLDDEGQEDRHLHR